MNYFEILPGEILILVCQYLKKYIINLENAYKNTDSIYLNKIMCNILDNVKSGNIDPELRFEPVSNDLCEFYSPVHSFIDGDGSWEINGVKVENFEEFDKFDGYKNFLYPSNKQYLVNYEIIDINY